MRLQFTLAAALIALTSAASAQQAPQGQMSQMNQPRTAGTVKSVTATEIVLTTAAGDVNLAVTPQTRVLVREKGAVDDIKAGTYLGTANQDSAEPATGTANEIHMMDNGPNVNSPMNTAGLTMTNGHVKSVSTTAKGKELDIDYGQATTRHVVVGKDTPVTRAVDVGVAGLKPGANVSAMTTEADGKKTATYISVSAAPAKP